MDATQDPVVASYRERISAVDGEILDAVNRRVTLVAELHRHKREQGYPMRDPAREQTLIDTLNTTNTGAAVRTAAGRPVPALARDLHERGRAAGRPARAERTVSRTPLAGYPTCEHRAARTTMRVTMNLREDELSAPAEPSATTMVVAAHGITRDYGEGDTIVQALRGVDVEIPPGQFTAVMGPSGSGKSTLMHILAGLDRPTTGTVVDRRPGDHRDGRPGADAAAARATSASSSSSSTCFRC